MSDTCDNYFDCCLFFTASTMSRLIAKMTEEVFMPTGLAPSYAFMQMLVNETPGITQNTIAAKLNLAPSTVTRFLEKLLAKGLVTKTAEGKQSLIHPTAKGQALDAQLKEAWKALYDRYCDILGEAFAVELTASMAKANRRLGEK